MTLNLRNCVKTLILNNVALQQLRLYSRWSYRRPARVYSPEEYEKIENGESKVRMQENAPEAPETPKLHRESFQITRQNEKEAFDFKVKKRKPEKALIATYQKSKVNSKVDMLETVFDEDGNFIYTKMNDNDKRVGTILTEIKSRSVKKKSDLILLEGKRIIRDALHSGCQLKYILFSRKDDVEFLKPHLPKMGVQLYKMPYREIQMWSELSTTPGIMGVFKIPNVENYEPKESVPITVICDNIREPGNLGSILRICAAVGCSRVILTHGCVNLWDTKVLRSSAGAHFKLRINTNVKWEDVEAFVDSDSHFFIADNKLVSDSSEKGEDTLTQINNIPVLPYFEVNFGSLNHLVLVVGGETLGISKDSYELALKTNGARLNIPLCNDVDSLNVGAALGVIVFEMKKQLIFNK